MHYSLLIAALSAVLPFGSAFPGLGKALVEIRARAAAPITSVEDSNELVGDLVSPGPSTPVGQVDTLVVMQIAADEVLGSCRYNPGES